MSEMDGEPSSANGQRPLRPTLRQATLILPKTGERVKRSVTFREPELIPIPTPHIEEDSGVRTPLLRRSSASIPRESTLRTFEEAAKDGVKQLWRFATSKTGHGILKCSLAYLLGSLATFVAPIAAFLGHQDGKHIVATVAVYFHPARSQGSMYEAVVLAFAAFVYAAVVSFASMGTSVLFDARLGMPTLGHAIVLIVFCGGGLGLLGWVKQRLGNALVNVSCSLASLAIITVLTKEGAVQAGVFSAAKVVQVLKMVILGCLAATIVCFLVKPVSARRELKMNMIQVTDSFSDMLTMITRSFLSGSEEDVRNMTSSVASHKYRSVFATLSKNLKEAKYEHYLAGTEREYEIETRLVECMQRLAHDIGGLRSAASTQYSLLAQHPGPGAPVSKHAGPPSPLSPRHINRASPAADATSEAEDSSEDSSDTVKVNSSANESSDLPARQWPAEIFSQFIAQLGPSLKSLAFTLKEILDELPYTPGTGFRITVNRCFTQSLREALELYGRARAEALAMLYLDRELRKSRSIEVEADFEEVAASCGHFSYSLEQFAKSVESYLETLDELRVEVEERPAGRSWKWLRFWKWSKPFSSIGRNVDPERDLIFHGDGVADLRPTDLRLRPKTETQWGSEKQPPKPTYRHQLWRALGLLRRDDTKFAIKVGAGAALYALPSYLTSTRPTYQHWRGEWGLLSYMLVCSMTIGAANTTSYSRFLGTCIGAICAVITWLISHGNAYALAFFGWIMALWTAYIIIAKGNGPMGRFIMLTYNLSALYAYSLSVKDANHDDDEGGTKPIISEIVLHRVVAVLTGCLWGLVVTRVIWAISARRRLTDGLSLLWLRMGLIWKRDPLSALLDGQPANEYMNLGEEFELHRYLSRLEDLRKAACSEYQLREHFPNDTYSRILQSTSKMLDAFHAMNVLIMKDPTASEGERRLLTYTADERAQLCARIGHLFHVLASSMKLEFPLTDALPNTEHARDRLLAKIYSYRRNEGQARNAKDEDFAVFYAYALVTRQLSQEIDAIAMELERLFGVLNEDVLKLR